MDFHWFTGIIAKFSIARSVHCALSYVNYNILCRNSLLRGCGYWLKFVHGAIAYRLQLDAIKKTADRAACTVTNCDPNCQLLYEVSL